MTDATRDYDFAYAPVVSSAPEEDGDTDDVVVATETLVEPSRWEEATRGLASLGKKRAAETLVARAPLFWTRLSLAERRRAADVEEHLRRAGIPVRYVTAADRPSMRLGPPLEFGVAAPLTPSDWRDAAPRDLPSDPRSPGRWFLRDGLGGLAVDREGCGTGRGARLAVIDDDAADFEQLDLDATVLVGLGKASSASGHGALMVGWAVGATTHEGTRFLGVAPDASVRAYLIPRPTDDVAPIAVAIARAAMDGADVIVCATYVSGMSSPLLDDALSLATTLGRGGRGCAVVFPTGREASSPERSIHASLSLSIGDPACDPRVICVAPGGRRGGWFLWRDQHERLRPFSNRGPAVRLLAPGDDIAYPFFAEERAFHAESSGAAALAAGVLLLVLASNPSLHVDEMFAILARCAAAPEPLAPEEIAELTDPVDARPRGRDADGHDAKHGYGRIHALRSCLAAKDPIALELVAMGEPDAARAWAALRAGFDVGSAYSPALAAWAVRALLGNPGTEHAVRVVLRHLRLLAADPRRADAQPRGALLRQLALVARELARSGAQSGEGAPAPVRAELTALQGALFGAQQRASEVEAALVALARQVFAQDFSGEEPRNTT